MPETPSLEFRWLVEMGYSLAESYAFRWIAVDGNRIKDNWRSFENIIVADGDTLGEAVAIAQLKLNRNPLLLFYAFIRPPLKPFNRHEGGTS